MSAGSAELDGRIVASLEELSEQQASFDRVTEQLGADGFVAAWSRAGTHQQIDLKGSVERAYEQIVNDLHNMLDLVERAAYQGGLVPDPRLAQLRLTRGSTSMVDRGNSRDALQHAYAQRNAARGREVWESMRAFRLRQTDVLTAVLALRDRVSRLDA